MNEKRIEGHHVLPISLWWPDERMNIMDLKAQVHRDLHYTLDMPVRKYSSMNRKAKKRSNGHIILPPDAIEARGDMQRLFFDNINELPLRLQQKHVRVMNTLMLDAQRKYSNYTWENLDYYEETHNEVDTFHNYHEARIIAQKELAKELWMGAKRKIFGL